jgi:hypothetical protein
MEHSEEYYKMKYFKYKAKYTKEKQAQQRGGNFIPNLGFTMALGKGISYLAKGISTPKLPTLNRDGAKKDIFLKAFEFYVAKKKVSNADAEKKIWNGITKYKDFEKKFEELKELSNDEKTELKQIKEKLYKWCKNTVFVVNEIDKDCKLI